MRVLGGKGFINLPFRYHTVTVLLFVATVAGGSPSRATVPVKAESKTGQAARDAGDLRLLVQDIALRPGGVMRGRLVGDPNEVASVAGRRILLIHQGQVLGETISDEQGRFLLQRLPSGIVELMLDSPDQPRRLFCRLWAPGTAPAGFAHELAVSTTQPVIRGQNPFLTMGFPNAATWAGIATGAVAAPVIYHNLQQQYKAPAPISP
ncbi:MAG: hypothetical protein JW818_18100 [Pirellulales bacterium]|nr:hypothetical protein [Pirellulales bacterium]